jgi:hypothetical protein
MRRDSTVMTATRSGFEIDEQDGPDAFDARSLAVRRAGTGAVAWRAARDAQLSAVPDHIDLYGLTRELVLTLGPLGELMRVISRQGAGYADGLPPGEQVYDDSHQDDPRALLAQAAEVLADIATKVTASGLEMHRFWSLIGRIGVEEIRSERTRIGTEEAAP